MTAEHIQEKRIKAIREAADAIGHIFRSLDAYDAAITAGLTPDLTQDSLQAIVKHLTGQGATL